MRQASTVSKITAWITLSLVFAGVAGAAAGAEMAPAALAVTIDRSAVSWQGAAGYHLTLSVSGPGGFYHHEELAAGIDPRFEVFSEGGDYRAAGTYTWEIVAVPATKTSQRRPALEQEQPRETPGAKRGFSRSGHFSIAGGAFVDPSLKEPIGGALKDQVIADDLIVDGSICVGFDCVNGESFGADTIRLKEHNLRIHFQDTSNVLSYPSNDWRITVNSRDNGGLNMFSIDDVDSGLTPFTIEARAPSSSLYVDDGGRVGLGTAVPVVELHTVDGDTPTLRLQQDGSAGFTPQTWDVAGNEANFFIRDATNGSTLPFRIEPGASSNALVISGDDRIGIGAGLNPAARFHIENTSSDDDDMVVTASGRVGIGTTAPAQAIHIAAEEQGLSRLRFDDGDLWDVGSGKNNTFIIDQGLGQAEVSVDASGTMVLKGGLITGSSGACDPGPCDGTFTDYEVESIEEHAAFMWQNSYLWGVGPTPEGAPINLTRKTTGILHELEKAHIYIEQLHHRAKEKVARIAELERSVARLERLLSPDGE